MFQTWMVANPWDLDAEGLEVSLDLIRGHFGFSGVALRALGPPVLQMSVRATPPTMFRTEGGLYFQPDSSCYASSRCKPPTADWIKSRNPIEKAVARCHSRDLHCRLMVSASRVGRLAERQPAFATKNALGSVSHRSICPLNPDVQAWLFGLIKDLASHYEPSAVVLCDVGCTWSDAAEVVLGLNGATAPLLRRLLAACLCESCRQGAEKAGIDIGQVDRVLTERIAACVRGESESGPVAGHESAKPDIVATFLGWQANAVAALVENLRDHANCEIMVLDDEHCESGDATIGAFAADGVGRIRTQTGGTVLSPDRPESAVRNEARLILTDSLLQDGSSLVQQVTSLAEAGLPGVSLDHFGAIPEDCDSAVRQAVRFARRTTDA